MNRCQLAEFFGVSRTTINDWARRGAPIEGGYPGAIAEWATARTLRREGLPAGRLPELAGRIAEAKAAFAQRAEIVNSLPAETVSDQSTKAAIVFALQLEAALLNLPAAVLKDATPDTIHEKLCEHVLAALAAVRGEADSPPGGGNRPGDARRKRAEAVDVTT